MTKSDFIRIFIKNSLPDFTAIKIWLIAGQILSILFTKRRIHFDFPTQDGPLTIKDAGFSDFKSIKQMKIDKCKMTLFPQPIVFCRFLLGFCLNEREN